MRRIDFHSHILPGLDDGPKDAETAVEMMRMMAEQSVEVVVATPHFFSLDVPPSCFKEQIRDAWDSLEDAWKCSGYGERYRMPQVLFGAEVYLDRNLLLLEGLESLCVTGTDLLLLEFPSTQNLDRIIPYITDLSIVLGIRPVIAHVERFLPLLGRKEIEQILKIPGISFQFNNYVIWNHKALRFLNRILKEGYLVFFGSDCHDPVYRAPSMGTVFPKLETWIERKFGKVFLTRLGWRQQRELKWI